MSTHPDRSSSALTLITVHYSPAGGADAVVDTFAVALNQGSPGTPTDTLTSLLRRAEPVALLDATVDLSGRPSSRRPERRRPHHLAGGGYGRQPSPSQLDDPESPR